MVKNDLKQWIWESLLLDLANDEEDEALAEEATKASKFQIYEFVGSCDQPPSLSEFLQMLDLVDALANKTKTIRKNKFDDFVKLCTQPDRLSSFLQNNSVQIQTSLEKYFLYFKILKWFRVTKSLAFDCTARNFAQKQAKFELLREAYQQRTDTLNSVSLHSLSTLSCIKHENKKEELYNLLLALFHSEACASAKQQVSFGLASSFSEYVQNKFAGSELFNWIAEHNQARGRNHMRDYLEASKSLDHKVDGFPDKVHKFSRFLPLRISQKDREGILYRLLYFPAVLTLAQALEDLKRHAERRFYLRSAQEKAKEIGAVYWIETFRLCLAFSDLDTKRALFCFNGCDEIETKLGGGLKPKQTQQQYLLCGQCGIVRPSPSCPDWTRSIMWLFCWHSCEPAQLHKRIKSTCDDCRRILRLPKKEEKSTNEIRQIKKAIENLFSKEICQIKDWAGEDSEWLKDLLDSGGKSGSYPTRDLRIIWQTGKALCLMLQDLKSETTDKKLNSWNHSLKTYLDNDIFNEFRSRNDWFETIQPNLDHKSDCPAISRKKIAKRSAQCGAYGCAYHLLHLGDKRSQNGEQYASLDYYFSVMAAQQARFRLYLEKRTGNRKHYGPGEADTIVPDFELVALRRWNSFSPNLGSRSSISVGGGYLVRLYDPESKRYISVAVDPGYNFLENLFNEGFTIPDIDLVVITHAHPDHTENLTNIFTLLREREKRIDAKDSSILLAMTEGVFERYRSHLESEPESIRNIAVLRAKEARGNDASGSALWLWAEHDSELCHIELKNQPVIGSNGRVLKIEAMHSLHFDGTYHDSIGVVFTQVEAGHKAVSLGILSDTRYHRGLEKDYADCSVIVAHLGSLLEEAWYKNYHVSNSELQEEMRNYLDKIDKSITRKINPKEHSRNQLNGLLKKKNHLYLPGLTRFICDLKSTTQNDSTKLVLLSEFGEELRGGLRTSLVKRLKNISASKMHFIPVDVGLRVDLKNMTVFCSICHRYRDPQGIVAYSVLPAEEAIAYICSDCKTSRPGELDRLVEEWCHSSRPVVPLNKESGS